MRCDVCGVGYECAENVIGCTDVGIEMKYEIQSEVVLCKLFLNFDIGEETSLFGEIILAKSNL